jgi:hypothetical protein
LASEAAAIEDSFPNGLEGDSEEAFFLVRWSRTLRLDVWSILVQVKRKVEIELSMMCLPVSK